MIHTIRNETLSVSINQIGAELCSIIDNASGTEYIWNGNPEFWTGRAPILFPIVGALKNKNYIYKGKNYSLPQHGFVRNNDCIKLKSKTEDKISFSLFYSEETLRSYPFQFELIISFVLDGNTLSVEHEIFNLGTEDMFFSIGGHPAFKCPLKSNESYNDYTLEFEVLETDNRWKIDKNGLISSETKPILENTKILPLHDKIFDEGAIILKQLKSKSISLVNKQKEKIVKVTFPDFNIIGIWSKPKAPFICIEPWLGIADSTDSNQQFEKKEGIIKLRAIENYKAVYSIEVYPNGYGKE